MESPCSYSISISFTQQGADRRFFQIAGCCCHLFIFLVVQYYNVFIDHDLFIQSIVDEQLGCSHSIRVA